MLVKYLVLIFFTIINQSTTTIYIHSETEIDYPPFYVEILNTSEHLCSGSLINLNYVTGPATCFYSEEESVISKLDVVAGKIGVTRQSRGVKKVYAHPFLLANDSYPYNIGLLRVTSPFIRNDYVAPISLTTTYPPLNQECEIFGKIRITADARTFAVYRSVTTTQDVSCATEDEQYICVKWNDTDIPCLNDSGVPLICNDRLQGIFIQIPDFCFADMQIYMNVAIYWDFIDAITKEFDAINIQYFADKSASPSSLYYYLFLGWYLFMWC